MCPDEAHTQRQKTGKQQARDWEPEGGEGLFTGTVFPLGMMKAPKLILCQWLHTL